MQQYHKNNGEDNLLIFFLGWSCDHHSMGEFELEGFDILYIYDYRELDALDLAMIARYRSSVVIGWSFGVWAAAQLLGQRFRPTLSIAVNGTANPIDDKYGIPNKIFNFTLRRIRGEGIEQFNRRVWGELYGQFVAAKRDVREQFDELETLGRSAQQSSNSAMEWDYAIIGTKDVIFPPQNMIDYWDKKSKFAPILLDAPHFAFGNEGTLVIKNIIEECLHTIKS